MSSPIGPTWALVHAEVERAYQAGREDAQLEMAERGQVIVTDHIFAVYESLGYEISRARERIA